MENAYLELEKLEEFEEKVKTGGSSLVYFSHEECSVCKVLKPKVAALLQSKFPEMKMFYVNIIKSPMISGQLGIFAVPTLLVFFEGMEYIRESRNISVDDLGRKIERLNKLMLD